MLGQLNHDTLAHVISFLDAPATVCLALTNHKYYESVLLICRCKRLEDICPRDVGKPIPIAIREQSFNMLVARATSTPFSSREAEWTIANPRNSEIRDTTLRYHGYRSDEGYLMAEHLAYIRMVEWFALQEDQQEGGERSPRWPSRQPSERGGEPRANPLSNSPLCKPYIRYQLRNFSTRLDDISRNIVLMIDLWNQDTIEAVEFMVLKQQLGEGWIKTKPTSLLRLKQRDRRRAGAIDLYRQLPGLVGLGQRRPSRVRRVAHRVAREFGYLGRTFAGFIWIEEHVRDMLPR
ncbi:hypothetical protein H2200_000419 [Cladophialophora chaetospira]|uniref:F-box domain-containing protein n=1 Tax=Cladophialophora chaetospira TaxID=386627 RepID=A0AA38XNE1_9EURO|nr:hypothetical protein H2200_000419 [Cladophialophora chaetospira]